MFGTGVLGGLLAKLAGLGSVTKVAVATTTAALTMTVAGAAAGVLPVSSGQSAPGVTAGALDHAAPVADTPLPPTSSNVGAQTAPAASLATPAGSASTAADTGAAVEPLAAESPSPPSLPIPIASLPDLSKLTQIPKQVMSCLTPVFDVVKSLPAVPTDQISQIGPTIVGCVSGIVKDLPLPFGLNTCVSNILAFVSNITSQLPMGTPTVGTFDISSCIPAGLPVPTGLPGMTGLSGGLPFFGGGFPFGR